MTDVETFIQASVHSCANAILPFVAGTYFCEIESAKEDDKEEEEEEEKEEILAENSSDQWWVRDGEGDDNKLWWTSDSTNETVPQEKCASACSIPPEKDSSEDLCRRFQALDDFYDASNANSPLRRASRAQGMALLTVYEKCFAGLDIGIVTDRNWDKIISYMKRAVRKGDMQGHAPICFGVLCRGMGIELSQSYRLFLFLQVRSIISAAVRLGVIGPYASQRLLASFHLLIDKTVSDAMASEFSINAEHCKHFTENQYFAWLQKHTSQTAPLVDIWQGVHDRLFAKLFWT